MSSRARTKAEANTKHAAKQEPPTPNWPALQPSLPASDLCLETLLEDQIIVIRNLLTSNLCKKYVSFLSALPLITTPVKPKDGDAVRVNDRIEFQDFAFAEQLWRSTALQTLLTDPTIGDQEDRLTPEAARKLWGGHVCGLSPRIRIYRYREGQFFAQHYDDYNTLLLPTSPPTPAKTTWTLLIYLTGPSTGCVGGETVFYPSQGSKKSMGDAEPMVVGLEVGMALLHKHGKDCLLHEGRRVERGEKWVLRTDLCVRR